MAQWWRIHLPMEEMWVPSLGQEDPLEKEMAIHSSILAWKIPWAEKPGALQSMGSLEIYVPPVDTSRRLWAGHVMLITQVVKQAGRWSHEPNSHGGLAARAPHAHRGVVGGDSRWSEPPPARSSHCCVPKAHFPSADTVCLDPLKVTEGVLSKPLRIWSSFFLSSSPAFPKHQWEKEVSVRIGNRKELWSPGLEEGKIWGFSQIIWNNKRMGFRELCFLFVPKRLLTVEVLRFGPKEKWSYKT